MLHCILRAGVLLKVMVLCVYDSNVTLYVCLPLCVCFCVCVHIDLCVCVCLCVCLCLCLFVSMFACVFAHGVVRVYFCDCVEELLFLELFQRGHVGATEVHRD